MNTRIKKKVKAILIFAAAIFVLLILAHVFKNFLIPWMIAMHS